MRRTCVFNSTIRYDASFFTSLDRVVQSEPWLPRDRAMIDMLRSLGIEKGKPFNPDAKTKAALDAAAREAQAWLEARYDTGLPTFYAGGRWTVPAVPELLAAVQADFNDPDKYPVDARGFTYTFAFIGIKRLGTGQFYLVSLRDKDGNPFDGGKTYRLTVPANPPVEQYWSVTAYDRVDACSDPQHAAGQPLVADSRNAEECRRLGRRLLRPCGAGRQGVELGADRSQARLRTHVPRLCADQGVLRQDVEAAGRRTRELEREQ